ALVAGLGDQRELLAGQVREGLERVEVRVRSEQPDPTLAGDPRQLLLATLALLAQLAEPGREDDAELRALLHGVPHAPLGVPDHHHRDVDVVRYVGERRVALDPVDLLDPRIDRVHLRALAFATLHDLAKQRVAGLALVVRGADQRDRPRVEEEIEVRSPHRAGLHCGSDTPSSTSSNVTSTGRFSRMSSLAISKRLPIIRTPSSSSITATLNGTRSANDGSTGGCATTHDHTRPRPQAGSHDDSIDRHFGHIGCGGNRNAPHDAHLWITSSWRAHAFQK